MSFESGSFANAVTVRHVVKGEGGRSTETRKCKTFLQKKYCNVRLRFKSNKKKCFTLIKNSSNMCIYIENISTVESRLSELDGTGDSIRMNKE